MARRVLINGGKNTVKFGALVVVVLVTLAAILGAVRMFDGLTSSEQTNQVFNAAATVPPGLVEAVTWDGDASDLARPMEPLTRADLGAAWIRAWEQINIAAQTGDSSGMEVYFANSALDGAMARVDDMAGLPVHQLSHRLRVDFYSRDGQVVGLTAPEVRLVRAVAVGDGIGWLHTVESFEAILLLEDGNFRVQHWVRRDARSRWWTEPIETGSALAGKAGTDRLPRSGVNYYPRDHPFESFWSNYDPATVTADLDRIAALGADSVRVFVPFDDTGGRWATEEDLAPVLDLADRAHARGLGVVITLFDGRTDHRTDNWDSDRAHLATVVPTLARHPALTMWDVKNEPDRDIGANGVGEQLLYAWLGEMAHEIRRLDPATPITVGWSTPQAALAAPVQTDVVSYHYYGPANELVAWGQAVADHAEDRPVLLTEYGLPTWNTVLPGGHTEREQAAYVADIRDRERAAGVDGSMIWTLWDLDRAPADAGIMPWSTGPQKTLGVLRPDGTPKPAAAFVAVEPGAKRPDPNPFNRLNKPFWQLCLAVTVIGVGTRVVRRRRRTSGA